MIATLSEPVPAPEPIPSIQHRVRELGETISASRLNLWASCRLKFYFRYVEKLVKPPSRSMHAGSSVHAVLQAWNMSRWRREPFVTDRFRTVFDEQWSLLQTDTRINWGDEEKAERSSSWRVLEHYFTETPIRADERPEAVEVAVSADLSKHGLPTLIGVLDLVRSGGRIVDFKVVGKSPDPELVMHTTETQLTAYSLLYRDATGKREGGLELHHLVRTKTPKLIVTSLPPAKKSQEDRLFRQIESYQEGLDNRDFVPSPGFACAGCEFFNECRRWVP